MKGSRWLPGLAGLLAHVSALCPLASAACLDEGRTCVTAARVTNVSAPFIDGDLGDPACAHAGTLAFPNAVGGEFRFGGRRHAPSSSRLRFLHDDVNLYMGFETDDEMVESADVYENSDGLAGLALARKGQPPASPSHLQLTWFSEPRRGCRVQPGGPQGAGGAASHSAGSSLPEP